MRLPRFRFTVRRLMVAMAIVALLLGGGILGRRSLDYRRLAAFHEQMEQRKERAVRGIEILARAANDPADAAAARRDAAYEAQIGRHHAALKAKYLRAASRPWLPVPPDPPPPRPGLR
jgi:hypothetical protein